MKNENIYFGRTAVSLISRFSKTTSPQLFEDSALVFTKVDTTKKRNIEEFCLNYHYIPSQVSGKSFIECFHIEQQEVKRILNAYRHSALTAADLDFINEKLHNLEKKLIFSSNLQILSINENLCVDKEIGKDTDNHIIYVYSGSTSNLMWLQVSDYILREQKLLECKNCNSFFVGSHSRTNQHYCSVICGNQYRQNIFKSKKKKNNGFGNAQA